MTQSTGMSLSVERMGQIALFILMMHMKREGLRLSKRELNEKAQDAEKNGKEFGITAEEYKRFVKEMAEGYVASLFEEEKK